MSAQKFNGKVAVITGSSRGIGKAIALELAKRGAFIVLNGRDFDRLNNTESEIKSYQTGVISVCCDVSTNEGGRLLISEAVKAFGRIDFLINNVGVSMRGNVCEMNPDVFRATFESNYMSAVCPTIPALDQLRLSKGSLVFISSLAGIRGLPFISAYSSSKMALRALAESIRIEEADHGIHVGLVFVGITVNDAGKETLGSDGSRKLLEPRSGSGVQSKESVAVAVLKNITKRKFISVLTFVGKLNYLLQHIVPQIVERIIIKNIRKFEERSR
ncbi:MAG TPA: SDR family oxidoreductase [Prolixibacteraceae bacterium]